MKLARESEQKWTACLLQGTKIETTRTTRSDRSREHTRKRARLWRVPCEHTTRTCSHDVPALAAQHAQRSHQHLDDAAVPSGESGHSPSARHSAISKFPVLWSHQYCRINFLEPGVIFESPSYLWELSNFCSLFSSCFTIVSRVGRLWIHDDPVHQAHLITVM